MSRCHDVTMSRCHDVVMNDIAVALAPADMKTSRNEAGPASTMKRREARATDSRRRPTVSTAVPALEVTLVAVNGGTTCCGHWKSFWTLPVFNRLRYAGCNSGC
jgi:hypothetical protein